MTAIDVPTPATAGKDEFDQLVDKLRNDFRRLFPHLRPTEQSCFFVARDENSDSGKVWIEFIKERDGQQILCRISMIIENNRAVRRVQEEIELEEKMDGTSLIWPG